MTIESSPPSADGSPDGSTVGSPGAAPTSVWRRSGDRLLGWMLGPPRQARLTITHCVHGAAETFFTVSMAGSIFFSVSAEAARPRVLLFLVVTLAPFLVMAPLVGPLVDRVRGGLTTALMSTFLLRAVLALLLAENLRTVLLFPLAFGVLVATKTYSVARNALVPSVVDDEQDLVAANARLSRSGTFASALALVVAVTLYSTTSGVWTLRVGAAVYVVGAISAWRVKATAGPIEPVEPSGLQELVRPDVSGAVWDMMVLRAALGFALFQFGFSLRSDGEPAWVLGALILANGFGGFMGTVISPSLRRHVTERSMFTGALVAPAVATLVAGIAFDRITLLGAIFVLGLSVSVGRRALDATIQTQAPHARRGQVYASLETRLELAWVLAACLAVAVRVASWVGILALAGFLAFVAIVHLRRRSGISVLRPMAASPLAERLLMRAETLANHGFFDEAIIVARAANEAAVREAAVMTEPLEPDAADLREQARRSIDLARRRIDGTTT